MRQRGSNGPLDPCISDDDLRIAWIVHGWIHSGQYQVLVMKRSRSLQAPKRCWFSVSVVTDRRRAEYRADGLSALMRCIHSKYVAHRRDAKLVSVSQIQAVEAIDELSAIDHRGFFRIAIEDVEGHSAEHCVAQSRNLLELIAWG